LPILILAEHAEGRPSDISLQALTLARSLAADETVHALLIGSDGAAAGSVFGAHGVAVVHIAEHQGLAEYAPDAWTASLAQLAERLSATAVVAAASDRGADVMARLAARAGLPLASNCIAATPGPPVAVTRLRWGGSLLEEANLHSPLPLLTIAPHAVTIEPAATPAAGEVRSFTPELTERELAVRVSEHVAAAGGGVSLKEAKVVVSGGRGVGSREGFAIIEELASLLGAAVGCSRAVTSAGWRPHSDQVGQTGTKIAPEVYIACGISGATQHMAGCKAAKRILAINSDADASIMSNADYVVIGDLKEIVPAITAEIRRQR
jgi:electron transfer flavoprotein alpha subunit